MVGSVAARLIERDVELACIGQALTRAAGGIGSLVTIEGEAGIGKTRLVTEACAMAADGGFLALTSRGGEHESDFEYGVVRQLLEKPVARATGEVRSRLLDGAARLATVVFDGGGGDEPRAHGRSTVAPTGIEHGLYWLTANLAETSPLLLTVDDAQWADPPSLRFLVHLARRLDGLRAVVVVGLRSGDAVTDVDVLDGLMLLPTTTVLRPAALSIDGAERMLAELIDPAAAASVAGDCHGATGGNPFLLGELAMTIRTSDPTAIDTADIGRLAPRSVTRSIMARLRRLPAPCRTLARVLTVLGDDAELRYLASLAQVEVDAALAAADELVSASIWVRATRPRFTHPIVRSAVEADLSGAERAGLHGATARLLMADGADVERVAAHLVAAVPTGDPDVVAVLRSAAGKALSRGATASAARWLRRALDEPPEPDRRGEVLFELGECELRCNHAASAVDRLAQSRALARDPRERATRSLVLARAAIATGRIADTVALLEQSIAALGPADRELMLQLVGQLVPFTKFFAPTQPRLERLLAEASTYQGATPGERVVLANLAVRMLTGRTATAVETADLARRALGGTALLADLTADDISYHIPGLCLTYAEAPHEAASSAAAAADKARALGALHAVALAEGMWSLAALRHGDVTAAEVHGSAAWGAASQLEPGLLGASAAVVAGAPYAEALRERGRTDDAQAVVDAMTASPGALPVFNEMQSHFRFVQAMQHAATGRLEQARSDLGLVAELTGGDSSWDPHRPWRAALVIVLGALGAHREAVEHAEQNLDMAGRWGTPSAIGTAQRVRALVDPAAPVIPLLERAVQTLQTASARLELAHAMVDLGNAYLRCGRSAEARNTLHAGRDLAHRCGASALESAARHGLHGAGARPRRPTSTGLESLTASERRIAQHAASGMTNREIAQALFVTIKTVEAHLASTYRKLRITARNQLIMVLAEAGTAHPAPEDCALCADAQG